MKLNKFWKLTRKPQQRKHLARMPIPMESLEARKLMSATNPIATDVAETTAAPQSREADSSQDRLYSSVPIDILSPDRFELIVEQSPDTQSEHPRAVLDDDGTLRIAGRMHADNIHVSYSSPNHIRVRTETDAGILEVEFARSEVKSIQSRWSQNRNGES